MSLITAINNAGTMAGFLFLLDSTMNVESSLFGGNNGTNTGGVFYSTSNLVCIPSPLLSFLHSSLSFIFSLLALILF
jgi:hypothetical protein